MMILTMVTDKRLWKYNSSPCKKCIVRATCNKSLNDGTACQEYMKFIIKLVEKTNENKT